MADAANPGLTITFTAITAEAVSKVEDFFKSVNEKVAQLNRVGKDEASKSVDSVVKNVSTATSKVAVETEAVVANVVQKVEKLATKGTQQAQEGGRGIVAGFSEILKVGEFATGIGAAIAGAFAIEAIVEKFKHGIETIIEGIHRVIEFSDEMGDLKTKTGLSLETLNALNKMASQSKLGFDGMSLGLAQFNDRLNNAVRMGGEATRVFRDLKIDIANQDGTRRDPEEVLRDVFSRFQSMPNGPGKTGAGFDLFGRGAPQWIPLLSKGPDAFDQLKAQGGGITPQMAEDAEEFNKAWASVQGTLKSVYTQVTAEILPALKDFAVWLKEVVSDSDLVKVAVDLLVAVFRYFATELLIAKVVVVSLVEAFDDFNKLITTTTADAIRLITKTFDTWFQVILDTIKALIDLAKTSTAVSGVLADVAKGDFKKAWQDASGVINKVEQDLGTMARSAAGAMYSTATNVGGFVFRTLGNTRKTAEEIFDDIKKQAQSFQNGMKSILGLKDDSKGAGGKEGAKTSEPPLPPSLEAERLLKEIEKQYQEATKTKLELLDYEKAEIVKKLDEEVFDVEKKNAALLQVEEIYGQKRRDIIDKQAEAIENLYLGYNALDQERIQNDPDLYTSQKKEQLLSLLGKENQLLQDNIELQRAQINNPAANQDQQLEAAQKTLGLLREQQRVRQQISTLKSDNFTTNFRGGLDRLSEEWSHFGRNFANVAINGIEKAVNGISDAIMGVIDGTRTWGQVFSQIGMSIIASIIQIMVQWIASMTIIAALKALFGVNDKKDAATSAAAWAPAAVAASIASYGAAAAIGTTAYLAGIFSGTAVTAGLSAAAFESGGVVPGGEQLIRVNERGTEAVLNARATSTLGEDVINALNAGILTAADLPHAMVDGLTQPSSGDSGESINGQRTAGRGAAGGPGGVTVGGHKLSVAFINSDPHSAAREFLKTAEGQRMIVDIARRKRLDIGIKT